MDAGKIKLIMKCASAQSQDGISYKKSGVQGMEKAGAAALRPLYRISICFTLPAYPRSISCMPTSKGLPSTHSLSQ